MVDWHRRFLQQARWTRSLRAYLFRRAGLTAARRVLEVGCGTGAVLRETTFPGALHGLDRDGAALRRARQHVPGATLTCGDALALPYADGVFDVTFCHFLLMWVADPLQALGEMRRVTRVGGHVLALAEPDYSRRVDRPPALAPLGRYQMLALQRQGADPTLGSRLGELFRRAGLRLRESGALQPAATSAFRPEDWELEWAVLEADLAGRVPAETLHHLKRLDARAWARGERVLYVPTFFAWGQVPAP